jgi:soluble lytic murein transglycosylase-like protein
MVRLQWLLSIVCALALPAARAQIYGGTDERGTLVLSDFRSESAPELVLGAPVAAPPAAVPRTVAPLATLIDEIARATALPPQLLAAVIAVESGFDARAVSRKGAQGLMQLMPATAQRFGVTDPFDPRQNIAGGAAYLKSLLQRFDGDLTLALAAYNAGEGAVIKAGYRLPPFDETRAYVPRVLARLQRGGWY